MRKTTNYGLSLYDKEDKMIITANENSLNANMEIIDNVLKEKATETYVKNQIANAQLGGGDTEVDLSGYATKDDLHSHSNKDILDGISSDDIEKWNAGGDISVVEPANDDIPKVFIDGTIPTTKDDVLATLHYISKTDEFFAYIKIKCQGTSSMSYPKKNFTVKLYSDEARETKIKRVFKNWEIASDKFVLKANYIDHSHSRNIISARLWSEIVSSRSDYSTLPEEIKKSPNNGAVDGFPIKVYTNGTYQGIYTWNIGKDAWMWGMDEDNPNHVLLCAEGNTDGVFAETTSNFRKLWDGTDGNKPGWSVEVGTNSAALKTSLNSLIQFVMDNDGDDFRNGISTYLDIQSAIDYYIFQYVACGLDGLAHNMLLATYDGKLWRCGAYDLDSTFGMWWNGNKFVSASFRCPEDYQERYSLLWERIEANYSVELKERYAVLRNNVLSYANMVTHFERFTDIIGSELYAEDLTIYSAIPSGSTNNIKQIRDYIRDRLTYCDGEFATMGEEVVEPDIPEEPDIPVEPGTIPYPLENGTVTAGVHTIEISNGNHVKLTYADNAWDAAYIPLSNISRINGGNIATENNTSYVSESFKLKTGDVVKLVKDNTNVTVTSAEDQTSRMSSMFLTTSVGSTKDIIKGDLFSDIEGTITITSDCSVDGLCLWNASCTGKIIDFDVELYVNDVRYI